MLRESMRQGTESGWRGAVGLLLAIEAALGFLFIVEMAIFSYLGSPDAPPDSILNASTVEICVSKDDAVGIAILRIRCGANREALRNAAVLYRMQVPEQAEVVSFDHGQPRQVVRSPDDDLAAVGCDDGRFYLLALGDKMPLPRLLCKNPRGAVDQLAFSPDGRLLASLDDSAMNVWCVSSGSLLARLSTTSAAFRCFTFLPDSKRVLLGNRSGGIAMWNIDEASAPETFARCNGPVRYLVCAPDGRRAVAGGFDGALHAWDVHSKEPLWQIQPNHWASTSPAVFAADSRSVISGLSIAGQGEISSVALIVWDAETGQQRKRLTGHSKPITTLAISGSCLLHSGSRDGTIRTWDLRSGKEVCRVSARHLIER